MDGVKEWIMQIAGVVVLASICEIIMVDGAMKKYVKPVLGFVFILTVIRPIGGLSEEKMKIDVFCDSQLEAAELSESLEERERKMVVSIYEDRLSEKIKSEIKNVYGVDMTVKVDVKEEEEGFGNIDKIKAKLFLNEGEAVKADSVSKAICEKFAVKEDCVQVKAFYK